MKRADFLPLRHRPGTMWRILAWGAKGERLDLVFRPGRKTPTVNDEATIALKWPDADFVFDEIVVDNWLHVEQMDRRIYWLRVGDADITVHVGERGEAESVHIRRGDHGEVKGATEL